MGLELPPFRRLAVGVGVFFIRFFIFFGWNVLWFGKIVVSFAVRKSCHLAVIGYYLNRRWCGFLFLLPQFSY